jgi:nucleoside-diphosphate-sugar epimerase
MIADKISWKGEVVWDTKPIRPGEIYWLNSNHRLMTSITGWEPKKSLSEGLDYTIAVWQDKLQQSSKKVFSIR